MDVFGLILAFGIGVVSGFFVSIPVGPINVTIINEGARRGFKWALMIGLGAVLMEVIYCALGFASFASLFSSKTIRAVMELVSFLLMLYLGLKYLRAPSVELTSKSAEKIEEKLHPHSAFTIGFVRVLGNPAVLIFWMTIAATYVSHEWVDTTWLSKSACILGVGVGAAAWFLLLSFAVAKSHHRFTTANLLRMSHISGLCLLVIAVIIGTRIIVLLSRH